MCQKWRMDAGLADLPDDVATLKAMVIAGREREARMQHLIDQMKRAQFGPRSEKLSPDQLALALDVLDVARAELTALGERADDAAASWKEWHKDWKRFYYYCWLFCE